MRRSTVGQRHADRADLLLAAYGVREHRHLRLGQRVALHDHAASQLLEATLRFRHERGGAAETELDRVKVHLSGAGQLVVQDRAEKRWHGADERRLHRRDLLQHVAEVARR
jgi:hypothetical protein